MKSRSSITRKLSTAVGSCIFLVGMLSSIAAGKCVAVLSPDNTREARSFSDLLSGELKAAGSIDGDMALAAFRGVGPESPFNMTTAEGKRAGAAIGCEFFILVRSEVLRRSSFSRPEYYEGFASIYTVSSRTGRLVDWRLEKHESLTRNDARSKLLASIPRAALQITRVIETVSGRELSEKEPAAMEEPPPADSPLAKDLHPPMPYRRVRPEYTTEADQYSVEATVDIVVDIDDKGAVLRTEIVRWAGFKLDESVEQAVRSMNWRPADRRGKSLPMRILLRYNFKKTSGN